TSTGRSSGWAPRCARACRGSSRRAASPLGCASALRPGDSRPSRPRERRTSAPAPRAPPPCGTPHEANTMISNPERVLSFDTTLRDGEQSPSWGITGPGKLLVEHAVDELGVDVIEA